MECIINELYIIKAKLLKSKVGFIIVKILQLLRINRIILKIHAKNRYLNPTKTMQETRVYFDENRTRIQNVLSYLADDKSKEIYTKMINYRETYNSKIFPEFSLHDQYFPKDIINLTSTETFIDCGAFTGDTVKIFNKLTDGEYNTIVCFEPDEINYKVLKKNAGNEKRIICNKSGVWNTTTFLNFDSDNGMNSRVDNDNVNKNIQVKVVSIDDTNVCQGATMIKMDVEGAEMNALKGARKIIMKNKPKLAICIYHSNADMIEIAEYIKEMVPEYRLYVRQHNFTICETVLYAIC